MSTLSASWIRKQIAVVNQDPILFSDTIEANIAYGRPHAKRSISEFATVDIQDAARRANALSFIGDPNHVPAFALCSPRYSRSARGVPNASWGAREPAFGRAEAANSDCEGDDPRP